MIFFAYIGFEAVSVAAQEARNPRRDLPIGILGSLGICTVLYILMAIVLLGVTDWRTLNVPNPVSFAIRQDRRAFLAGAPHQYRRHCRGSRRWCSSRSMASRACSIRWRATALSARHSAPCIRVSTRLISAPIIIGVAAALGAALLPLDILADLVSIGTLLAFVAVCGGIMILRRTAPMARRPSARPSYGSWLPRAS